MKHLASYVLEAIYKYFLHVPLSILTTYELPVVLTPLYGRMSEHSSEEENEKNRRNCFMSQLLSAPNCKA